MVVVAVVVVDDDIGGGNRFSCRKLKKLKEHVPLFLTSIRVLGIRRNEREQRETVVFGVGGGVNGLPRRRKTSRTV